MTTAVEETNVEASRLEQRRTKKRLMAERQQQSRKAEVIFDRVRGLDAKRESAAALHQEVCGPIQDSLAKLEAEITSLMLDRKPIPAKLEARRRELMESVMDANRVLEDAVQSLGREQEKLRNEAIEIQRGSGDSTVFENHLTSYPLGNAELLLEQYALSQAMKFLEARIQAAVKRLEVCQERVDETDARDSDAEIISWHLRTARHELKVANAEFTAAKKRGLELRSELLSE